MRRYFVVLAMILMALMMSAPVVSAAQPIQGYVAYSVTLNKGFNAMSKSFTINESAQPSNQNGFEVISFSLSTSSSNLTYSRLVNTSSVPEIFPFLPGITNQSFSYDYHGASIVASIFYTGTESVTFQKHNYSVSNYTFQASATNSSSGTTITANGFVITMPTGLVYSLNVLVNGTYSLKAQLIGTSLPLEFSSGLNSTVGFTMVGIGVLGAASLAIPFWTIRARKRSNEKKNDEQSETEKPSYWVD